MSVSSISSSNGITATFRKRAGRGGNAEAAGGQGPAGAGGPQGSPPSGPPPAGGPEGHGGKEMSKFEDILKSGGGVAELKAQADKYFESFKSSDKFKSLSADEQAKIQEHHDTNEDERLQGMVDQFAKTGSLKPPERPDGEAGQGAMLAELQQRGQHRQSEVYSQFGVGGFGTDAESATTGSTDTVAAEA